MRELRVHLLFIPFPDCVHWQKKRGVRKRMHDAGAFRSGGLARSKPQKLKRGKDYGHEKFQSFVAENGVGRDSGSRGDAAGVDAVVQGAGG
jgi:hypothetical protein